MTRSWILTGVWVEECKPAPKEPVWSRVEKKLHP
jgi:hypothetical protein